MNTGTTGAGVQLGVIGAGNIGSRHIQALARMAVPAQVFVVDPNDAGREISAARFEDAPGRQTHVCLRKEKEISSLPRKLDVVIIATNADCRLSVLQQLLATTSVKYLVIEKVLFQSVSDCMEARRLIQQSGATAWANLPRRMAPLYRSVRESLSADGAARFLLSGGQWDLGCNAVHYLDLLSFLGGSGIAALNGQYLDEGATPAKRSGYLQFSGTLQGELENGSRFTLTSDPQSTAPITLYCENSNHRWMLNEGAGSSLFGWHASQSGEWDWKTVTERIPYQSELSNLVVEELLETGNCQLTPLGDALQMHIPLLRVLNRHLHGSSASDEVKCPIT